MPRRVARAVPRNRLRQHAAPLRRQGETLHSSALEVGTNAGKNLVGWNRGNGSFIQLPTASLHLRNPGSFHIGVEWTVELLQKRAQYRESVFVVQCEDVLLDVLQSLGHIDALRPG